MGRHKMIALTPTASSILTLVAENPQVAWSDVRPLIEQLDDDYLREVVTDAVRILQGTVAGPDAAPAAAIATAYRTWAAQNSRSIRSRAAEGQRAATV